MLDAFMPENGQSVVDVWPAAMRDGLSGSRAWRRDHGAPRDAEAFKVNEKDRRDLDAARTSRVLKRLQLRRWRIVGVRQDCDIPCAGHGLHKDFQALAIELGPENTDTRNIATGMGERAHKTRGEHIVG